MDTNYLLEYHIINILQYLQVEKKHWKTFPTFEAEN